MGVNKNSVGAEFKTGRFQEVLNQQYEKFRRVGTGKTMVMGVFVSPLDFIQDVRDACKSASVRYPKVLLKLEVDLERAERTPEALTMTESEGGRKRWTVQEYTGYLDKKILRHLAIKAGRNTGYFVAPTLAGLKRATWCDDEEWITECVKRLVRTGQIRAALGTVDGELVAGFICLPAKHRGRLKQEQARQDPDAWNLTTADVAWLRSVAICAE